MSTRKKLAEVILEMSYRELTGVAEELYKMNAGDNKNLRNMGNKYGMAETLFDWADATAEET